MGLCSRGRGAIFGSRQPRLRYRPGLSEGSPYSDASRRLPPPPANCMLTGPLSHHARGVG